MSVNLFLITQLSELHFEIPVQLLKRFGDQRKGDRQKSIEAAESCNLNMGFQYESCNRNKICRGPIKTIGKNNLETPPELFDSLDQIFEFVSTKLPDEFIINEFSAELNSSTSIFVTFSWPIKSIFWRDKFGFALCLSFSVGLFLKYKSLLTFHKRLWLDSKLIPRLFEIFEFLKNF